MTPRTALATEYGPLQADDILRTLRKAGYIVVDKGAVGRAQREAYYEALEDARMGLVRADNGNERDQPQQRAA